MSGVLEPESEQQLPEASQEAVPHDEDDSEALIEDGSNGTHRKVAHNDSGIIVDSASVLEQKQSEEDDICQSPTRPVTMRVRSQVSRDSGYSVHSSFSESFEETSSSLDKSTRVYGTQLSRGMCCRGETSSQVLSGAHLEAMQVEAENISLKDNISELTRQLDDTVKEKEETEMVLKESESKLVNLQHEKESLQLCLECKSNDLEEFRVKVSCVEADRETLTSKCEQYEQDIASLKEQLASVSYQYDNLVKQSQELREKQEKEMELIESLRCKIRRLELDNATCGTAGYQKMQRQLSDERHDNQMLNFTFLALGVVLILAVCVGHFIEGLCTWSPCNVYSDWHMYM